MVTLSGDRPRNDRLIEEFPLFQHGEYDFYLPNAHWDIGLKSTYPESLKKKVAAALISESFGLKSIDNILRNYLDDVSYPTAKADRLDLRIRGFVKTRSSAFDGQLHALSISFDWTSKENTVIGLLTLRRAVFSMDLLAYCAQRGALFEGLAIARMMLEQIAWAYTLSHSEDRDAVLRTSATRAIGLLKQEIVFVGAFYGWLSQHVHWEFDAHKKVVISSEKGKLGHMFGSSYFKATVFGVMLIIITIYFECLWAICKTQLDALCREEGAKLTTPTDVRLEAGRFLREIVECDPDDTELRKLALILLDEEGQL